MISSPYSVFRRKVLIIDSDDEYRELYRVGLNSDRIQTYPEAYGAGGLNRLAREHFDLVILDFHLKDLSGMEIIREMKKRGDSTHVIVSSAILPVKLILDAVSHGITSFISKPVNLTQLRKAVDKTLPERLNPTSQAFQQARQLNFDTASRMLAEIPEQSSELDIWRQVFKALSQGDQISPYTGDLMDFALLH